MILARMVHQEDPRLASQPSGHAAKRRSEFRQARHAGQAAKGLPSQPIQLGFRKGIDKPSCELVPLHLRPIRATE